MATMEAESVDAVVTDPPYMLEFMGKDWDKPTAMVGTAERIVDGEKGAKTRGYAGNYRRGDLLGKMRDAQAWHEAWAREALRVLKPGGHLLAFGGTRTFHRLTCAIEDAGFEIRDCLSWLYGSGFPKSLDVSKAIDRARDDYEDRCVVAEWLRPHIERAGFAEVSDAFGFKDQTMVRARWTSRSQPNTPTWEQWERLRDLCDFGDEMDPEVWRLNGRKGQPGEAWAEREVIGSHFAGIAVPGEGQRHTVGGSRSIEVADTAPATPAARTWSGFGTALKPAWEPIILARKPLGSTVAACVLKHGTGGLNIDATRIGHASESDLAESQAKNPGRNDLVTSGTYGAGRPQQSVNVAGRWPANVVLSHAPECRELCPDCKHEARLHRNLVACCAVTRTGKTHTDREMATGPERCYCERLDDFTWSCAPSCPVRMLDEQSGESNSAVRICEDRDAPGSTWSLGRTGTTPRGVSDSGGASRFFLNVKPDVEGSRFFYSGKASRADREGSTHPTSKPTELMRWLIKLVTPPGGLVLDPFCGGGSTGVAAVAEGFRFIGIEQDADYVEISKRRIANVAPLFNTEEE
jgi:DNA modification methylase